MRRMLPSLLLLSVLSGCGFWGSFGEDSPTVEEGAPAFRSVELYLARASLLETQFEQYRLSGQDLYYECGEIKRGRSRVAAQRLAAVTAEQSAEIDRLAREVRKSIPPSGPKSLDEPGDLGSFADRGQFFLTLEGGERIELKTSLDSVDTAVGSLAALMRELAVQLRSIAREQEAAKKLCGNEAFYGLPG